MIREYTNREVAQIIREQEEGQIRLIPRLILKNNEVSVEFKLGRSRFYVLRDLIAFVQAIDSGASVSYGKQLTFHHSIYALQKRTDLFVCFWQSWFMCIRNIMSSFAEAPLQQYRG